MQGKNMSTLHILPCLDSAQMAASRRQELNIDRSEAATLGQSAVDAAREGRYITRTGQEVVWRDAVHAASCCASICGALTMMDAGARKIQRE